MGSRMTATTIFTRVIRRVRYWLSREERQRKLQDEMEFHLESMVVDLMDQGMPGDEARMSARRKFGNLALQAEDSRTTWIARWFTDAVHDLRYTSRTLRRDAGFTTFVILIVGLGIGASSTVFSVLNALLLKPLPFREPSELVWVANSSPDGAKEWSLQVDHYRDLRTLNKSLSDMTGYFGFHRTGDSKLTGDGEPARVNGIAFAENFFSFLGVHPLLGRLFTPAECQGVFRTPPAILLTEGLWRARYAADPGMIGRELVLNDFPAVVVGVIPDSFNFGSVFEPSTHIDLFIPFPLTAQTNRFGNTMSVIARLRPGVSVQSASAELGILSTQIGRAHPERNFIGARPSPLERHVSGRVRPALFVLACAVGVVMLIVCANLSNLQLARTSARQKEMAVRTALGAGRHRLLRQMLTESVTLSCAGAILGLVLAFGGTRLLAQLTAFNLPLLNSIKVDAFALGFTLVTAVLTGVLFGLLPAINVPLLAIQDTLRDSARGATGGKGYTWIRGALVISEIAFACVLLVGAGLLIRSFIHVLDVDLGFRPERAAALRIDPSRQYSDQAKRNAYYNEALRRVRGIPGIVSAGLTDELPLGGDRSWDVAAKGATTRADFREVYIRVIADGYLAAAGITLKAGRDLSERDTPTSEQVVLINESLARTLWPGQDAIGQVLTQDGGRRVVGIVGDVRHQGLEEASGGEMYIPMRQTNDYAAVDLVVRTTLPSSSLTSAVRQELHALDPNLPANQFRDLQELVDKSVSPRRFVVLLLTGFAAFALILTSLGIYGVVSYGVNQRAQEIGIRMALGASAAGLQKDIILQTLRLASVGLLVGALAAVVLARSIGSLLFGVTPADPLTFIGMAVLLMSVATVAGYLPARRASRIDPMIALRAN